MYVVNLIRPRYQWLTTSPNPHVRDSGVDAGQRGWRLHAVAASEYDTLTSVRCSSAACGVRAAHGWDMDLFIDRPCARCLVALGRACELCRGQGYTGKRSERHQWCGACCGTGRNEEERRRVAAEKHVHYLRDCRRWRAEAEHEEA